MIETWSSPEKSLGSTLYDALGVLSADRCPRGVCRVQPCAHRLPLQILKKRIDVLARGSAVVHLVGVLVHVHDENRQCRGRTVSVIGHPVVLELPRVQVEAQHDPAGSATEPRADPPELGLLGVEAAEGLCDRLALTIAGLAAAA